MSKRILIRILPDGSLEAETQGLKGDECLPYIPAIEALTDAAAVRSWFTEEHTQEVELKEQDRQRLDLGG